MSRAATLSTMWKTRATTMMDTGHLYTSTGMLSDPGSSTHGFSGEVPSYLILSRC